MATVAFKRGNRADLPVAHTDGTFYVALDERALYLDISAEERIRLSDFQVVADIEELNAVDDTNQNTLYYVTDINCLAKYDGKKFVQINPDTGATKVTVDGVGNAVTSATYDGKERTIKLTMGDTFAKADDIDTKITEKIGEIGVDTVKEYVDQKTAGITDEEGRITKLETNDTKQDGRLDALEQQIAGVSSAMHYKGEAQEDPAAMGDMGDYVAGDVVTWGEKEYVCDGEKFIELGDVTKEGQRIATLETKAAELEKAKHQHDNKGTLDGITEEKPGQWDAAYDAITWGTF